MNPDKALASYYFKIYFSVVLAFINKFLLSLSKNLVITLLGAEFLNSTLDSNFCVDEVGKVSLNKPEQILFLIKIIIKTCVLNRNKITKFLDFF